MNNSIKLIISIVLDLLGMVSYVLPLIGEFTDLIFAWISAVWIKLAYDSNVWAVIGGIEEVLPFTDIIPSCTLAHIFYSINSKKTKPKKKG